ncbi:hypothetical protein IWX50DRAFT_171163 [Phyllosticta citricarpa]
MLSRRKIQFFFFFFSFLLATTAVASVATTTAASHGDATADEQLGPQLLHSHSIPAANDVASQKHRPPTCPFPSTQNQNPPPPPKKHSNSSTHTQLKRAHTTTRAMQIAINRHTSSLPLSCPVLPCPALPCPAHPPLTHSNATCPLPPAQALLLQLIRAPSALSIFPSFFSPLLPVCPSVCAVRRCDAMRCERERLTDCQVLIPSVTARGRKRWMVPTWYVAWQGTPSVWV